MVYAYFIFSAAGPYLHEMNECDDGSGSGNGLDKHEWFFNTLIQSFYSSFPTDGKM